MKADLRQLAEKLVSEAYSKGLTVSFAESCTGGMIASSVTDVPGASAVFLGSAVTYSNEAKIKILGVGPDIIAEHGAVSAECAEKMAEGARRIFGSDVALCDRNSGPTRSEENRSERSGSAYLPKMRPLHLKGNSAARGLI